ncbi:MAG TPA: type III secretion system chaperone [Geminicoccaceae bacterium]|nr:type III secretion system chaperone [Geminicoccus sp.]HMU49115.1 type III secretion system chaperone [Geminicoccaceae bacterium]
MEHAGAERLLAAVGQQIGIAELALDDAGCCALSFDDVVVNFEADAESERLFLYAEVGDAPEGLAEALYRDILAANLLWQGTGGATLSLDAAGRRFVLGHAVPVGRIGEVDFVTTVERFVDIAETWRRRIAETGPQSAEPIVPLPGIVTPGMLA